MNDVAYIAVTRGVTIVDVYDLEDITMMQYYEEENGPHELEYSDGFLMYFDFFINCNSRLKNILFSAVEYEL